MTRKKKQAEKPYYLYSEVKTKGIPGKRDRVIRVYAWPQHRFMHLLGVPHVHVLRKGNKIVKHRAKMTHRQGARFKD